jgi:hypothetical protein
MTPIVAAFHDPGAFGMALPVLKAINQRNDVSLQVFVGQALWNRAKGAGLDPLPLSTALPLFKRIGRNAKLLTGTSWGSSDEQLLRNQAQTQGVQSFVFVDYWSSYTERWEGATYAAMFIDSERVFVVDSEMSHEMQVLGFRGSKLVTVGHPGWEDLLKQSPRATKKADVSPSVVFLSEPFRKEGSDPRGAILARVEAAFGKEAVLYLKPHPKEVELPTRSERWLTLDADLPIGELPGSDVVLGFQSMALIELALLGSRVGSIPFGVSSAWTRVAPKFGIRVFSIEEDYKQIMEPSFQSTMEFRIEREIQGSLERVLESLSR